MPWIVWLALTLPGLALVSPPVWGKPSSSPKMGRAGVVEYRTWTSSPRRDPVDQWGKHSGVCTYTVFALVTRERLMRLRIDGVEQLVDWSWSWEMRVKEGSVGGETVAEFIDPVTHEVVATHEIRELCWPRNSPAL